jgi:predicted XRE-type DNA-binding protein
MGPQFSRQRSASQPLPCHYPPRLNSLLRDKISKFSFEADATLASRVGLTVKMSVRKTTAKRIA